MKAEFDLDKIYTHKWTKKQLVECIKSSYDKEFQVVFFPRTKDNADILIRSFKEELENKDGNNNKD